MGIRIGHVHSGGKQGELFEEFRGGEGDIRRAVGGVAIGVDVIAEDLVFVGVVPGALLKNSLDIVYCRIDIESVKLTSWGSLRTSYAACTSENNLVAASTLFTFLSG